MFLYLFDVTFFLFAPSFQLLHVGNLLFRYFLLRLVIQVFLYPQTKDRDVSCSSARKFKNSCLHLLQNLVRLLNIMDLPRKIISALQNANLTAVFVYPTEVSFRYFSSQEQRCRSLDLFSCYPRLCNLISYSKKLRPLRFCVAF